MTHIDDLMHQHCPNGVEHRPLGELGQFERGSGIQKSDFVESGIGCIHYGQIHTHYGSWATETKSFVSPEQAARTRRARTGDLVVATTSEDDEAVGKAVAWLGADEVAVSTDAFIYRHSLDPKYVAYFFQTEQFRAQKRRHITGTKVRRLSGTALAKVRIPVPPLEVQRQISDLLDGYESLEAALESELDAELEVRKQQYAHYRDLLLNRSADLVQGGQQAELRNVIEFVNGKAHERVVDVDGEIALMTSRFISTNGQSVRYVQAENVRSPAFKDQIALVMSDLPNGRALARAFYVDADDRYAVNQRVCLLKVTDRRVILPRFLYYIVDRNPRLLSYDNGIDQTHLKKEQILEIVIPLPPLDVQRRIVSTLDQLTEFTVGLSMGLSGEREARRKQYEYYRDRLLTFEEAA